MQLSAEIRWFWRNAPPLPLEAWFREAKHHACAAGGGKERDDEYLRDPGQVELGIKQRGGKKGVEVKGLVGVVSDNPATEPFAGAIELWTKLTSGSLQLPPQSLVLTRKLRWLRKFDTTGPAPSEIPVDAEENPIDKRPLPKRGCNVELTKVTLPNSEIWWTLGMESFGTIETVASDLRSVASALAARHPPPLANGLLASYPAWLKQAV